MDLDSVSKEDLLKLAKRLQKRNKALEAQLASAPTPAPAPAPPSSEPATSSDDKDKLQALEKLLHLSQDSAAKKDAKIEALKKELDDLRAALDDSRRQRAILDTDLKNQALKLSALDSATKEVATLKDTIKELENLLGASEHNSSLKDEQIIKLKEELQTLEFSIDTASVPSSRDLKVAAPPSTTASPKKGSFSGTSATPGLKALGRSGTGRTYESALKAQLETLKLEVSDLRRANAELREVASSYSRKADAAAAELLGIEALKQSLQSEERSKFHSLKSEIASLHSELAVAKDRIRSAESKYTESFKELNRLREVLKLTGDEGSVEFKALLEPTLTVPEDEKISRYSSIEAEVSKIRRDYELEIAEMEKKFAAQYAVFADRSKQDDFDKDTGREFFMETETDRLRTEVAALRAEIDELERSRSRASENIDYLKNVVLKFLMLENRRSERKTLVPVLATILHFSPEENRAIQKSWEETWSWRK